MKITLVTSEFQVREDVSLGELIEMRRAGVALFWVDVESPDDAEMDAVAESFGMHHMTARDCLNRLVPVKWEPFEDHLYVVSHGLNFNTGADLLETLNLSILVFSDCCVTVHVEPLRSVRGLLGDFRDRRIGPRPHTPDWVLYALLDSINTAYGVLLEEVEDDVEGIDDQVLAGEATSSVLEAIGDARRHLAVLRRRMSPSREMLQQLSMRGSPVIQEETRVYLRDVLDSVIRNLEKSDIVRDAVTNAQSNYLAQIANRTNEVMKTLSIVATTMMPLSFLTGLFGMNVRVPGQDGATLWWFGGLVFSMGLLGGYMIFLFRRRGWL